MKKLALIFCACALFMCTVFACGDDTETADDMGIGDVEASVDVGSKEDGKPEAALVEDGAPVEDAAPAADGDPSSDA